MIIAQKKTGVGKTRLNSQVPLKDSKAQVPSLEVHLDYLRVKVELHSSDDSELISFLKFIHPNQSEWIISHDVPYRNGRDWYDNRVQSSIGVSGGYKELQDDNGSIIGYECVLDLGGLYFANYNLVDQWRLITGLSNVYSARCQRIDIAIDDNTNGKIIPIGEMWEATKTGTKGNTALFQKTRYYESGGCGANNIPLRTWYFGSRNSGKMVRVYEKELHGCNGEKRRVMRFESELKRKYSQKVFDTVASLERPYINGNTGDKIDNNSFSIELSKVLGGIALGTIDFVNRYDLSGKYIKEYARCKRLHFWQEFIDKIGSFLRIRLPKVARTTEKSIAWITRQVAGLLNAIKEGVGSAKLWEYLMDAMDERCKYKGSYHDLVTGTLREHPELLRVS